jgi:hypothetical protein
MSRRAQHNVVALIVLAAFLGIIYLSLGYGPRARMVPLPVAILGALLVLVQLAWQNLRPSDDLQIDLVKAITRRAEDEIAPERVDGDARQSGAAAQSDRRREVKAFAMVAVFLALVWLLGPITAAALFTFAYFVLSGQYGWLKAAMHTALFTAAVYLLFVTGLDVQLYHGVLEPLVHP